MEKQCLECGDVVLGRVDKKFCSDQCRVAFNNKQNSTANNYVRNVINLLRKNRRILTELNPHDKTKVHRDKLVAKGFNFNYHTNMYTTKVGTVYYFCFEQGYLDLGDGYFALVKRKEYLESR